jgi:hypothetical protein
MLVEEPRRVTRKIGRDGRISLANFRYHVGRWLAGETVDGRLVIAIGLTAGGSPDRCRLKVGLRTSQNVA